jgi:hypothetical protein
MRFVLFAEESFVTHPGGNTFQIRAKPHLDPRLFPQIPDGDPTLRRRFLVREYRAASVRSPELILTLESLERLATSTTFDPQEHSSNTVPITARPYKL